MSNKFYKGGFFGNRSAEYGENYDYYATPENATNLFLEAFNKTNEHKFVKVWEPACGEGHISKVLIDNLIEVKSSDILNRGFNNEIIDFLSYNGEKFDGDIITNPPYEYALEFINKALSLTDGYVIMLLRAGFIETKKRRQIMDQKLHSLYIHSDRIGCMKNGDPNNAPKGTMYAWFVFHNTNKKNYTKLYLI